MGIQYQIPGGPFINESGSRQFQSDGVYVNDADTTPIIVIPPRLLTRRAPHGQPRNYATLSPSHPLHPYVARAHNFNGLTGNGSTTGRYFDLRNGSPSWDSSLGSTPLGFAGDQLGVNFTANVANYLWQGGVTLSAKDHVLLTVFTPRVSSADLVTRIPIGLGSNAASGGAAHCIRCADGVGADISAFFRYADSGAFTAVNSGVTAQAGVTYAAASYSASRTEHYFFLNGRTYFSNTDLGATTTVVPNYTVGALRRGSASDPWNGVVSAAVRLSVPVGGLPIELLRRWTEDPWDLFTRPTNRTFSFPSDEVRLRWGADDNLTTQPQGIAATFLSGGQFVSTNATLTKFRIFKNNYNNSTTYWKYRVAVYEGGTSGTPAGATKIWDSGEVGSQSALDTETPDGTTPQWYEINCATVGGGTRKISSGARLWLAVKAFDTDIIVGRDYNPGNLEGNLGVRTWADTTTTGNSSTTVAFPDTYPNSALTNHDIIPLKMAIEYTPREGETGVQTLLLKRPARQMQPVGAALDYSHAALRAVQNMAGIGAPGAIFSGAHGLRTNLQRTHITTSPYLGPLPWNLVGTPRLALSRAGYGADLGVSGSMLRTQMRIENRQSYLFNFLYRAHRENSPRLYDDGSNAIYIQADGTLELTRGFTQNWSTPAGTIRPGAVHTVAVTHDFTGTGIPRIAVDGRLMPITGTNNTVTPSPSSVDINIGNSVGGDRSLDGVVSLAVIQGGVEWSASELMSLSANPWQLFAAPRTVPVTITLPEPEPPPSPALSVLASKTPAIRQPRTSIEINRASPLTQGMSLCVLPGELGSTAMYDRISGRVIPLNGSASAANFSVTNSATARGVRQTADSALGYLSTMLGSRAKSLLAVGAVISHNTRGAMFATATDEFFGFNPSGQLQLTAFAGALNVVGTTSVPTGRVVTIGARWRTANYGLFLNGRKDGGQDSGNLGDSLPANPVQLLGVTLAGFNTSQMAAYLFVTWDRHLSDAEFCEVTKSPWQLFTTTRPRIFVLPPQVPETPSTLRIVTSKTVARRQPQGWTSINWNSPLTRDLVGAFLPAIGSASAREVVQQKRIPQTSGSTSDVTRHSAMYRGSPVQGLDLLVSSPVFSTSLLRSGTVTGDYSLISLLGPGWNGQAMVGGEITSTGGWRNIGVGILDVGGGVMRARAETSYDPSITQYASGATTLNMSRPNLIGGRQRTGTGLTVFANGVSDGFVSNATQQYQTGSILSFGASTSKVYLTAGWLRALRDDEFEELAENPWQLFVELRPRIISIAGMTPSGRFIRHYPNIIISRIRLAGAYTDIDEDPSAADNAWLTFDHFV